MRSEGTWTVAAALALTMTAGACASAATVPPDGAPTTTPTPPTASAAPPSAPPTIDSTTTTTTPTTTTTVPPPSVPPGSQIVELTSDGEPRFYTLFVPDELPTDRRAALVLDLHGLGSSAAAQEEASGFAAKAAEEGFVVAQPAARGGIPTWNPQPGAVGMDRDVAFLRAVVGDVSSKVSIDPGRVYASGFSNGGGMAHRLACEAADLVAAIGTVSGQYQVVDDCDPTQPVAVISFHGTSDLVVPYEGFGDVLPAIPGWAEAWSARNGCAPVPERMRLAVDVLRDRWTGCEAAADVELYTVEGGAHAWPGTDRPGFFQPTQTVDATDVMWEFFQRHARS